MTEVTKIELAVPFRGQNSYEAWLRGVRNLADLLEWDVDANAWGGGIPIFLTLTPKVTQEEDGEEESDPAAVEDSAGSLSDSEPQSST